MEDYRYNIQLVSHNQISKRMDENQLRRTLFFEFVCILVSLSRLYFQWSTFRNPSMESIS